MIDAVLTEKRVSSLLLVCSTAIVCALAGCATDPYEYKAEADEKVYGIIEQKWTDDLPSPTNYRISDVTPGPNDIQIERVVPPDGVLTLPRAVALATAHNRQYQLEKEALYVMALDLRLARHEFEPWFFGIGSGGYATTDGDDGVGASANVGFNQLLATGARIGTQVAINWVRILTGDLEGGLLTSVLSANVTQPLLRGSDRRVVLENLTQAERDTLYQIRLFNRFRKTFVVEVISQFYIVLQLFDAVKNAEEYYESLVGLNQQAERLAGAGRLTRLELDRICQEKLEANYMCIQAQKEYKHALDEFKITLSLPATAELRLDETELEVLRKMPMTEPNFTEADAIETALHARLDLANSFDAVIDARRKVLVAADSLGAELNLTASATLPSRELSTSEAKALDDMFMAALELHLPLDRVEEQNVYRKALITLNQTKRARAEASDLVALAIRRDYRDLIAASERYGIESEELRLARKRFENSSLLLKYGRASSRRVLNAQDDLYDAQNAATEALVNFTIATLNFYRDTGVLQIRPDGMWTSAQAAGEPTTQDELPTTQEMPELQTEPIQTDVQEVFEQPATQIEPEPIEQQATQIEPESIEQPAQTTPVDA